MHMEFKTNLVVNSFGFLHIDEVTSFFILVRKAKFFGIYYVESS